MVTFISEANLLDFKAQGQIMAGLRWTKSSPAVGEF